MKKEDLRLVVALALLLAAGAATLFFSNWIESGRGSAAAAFLSDSVTHQVTLYADRAVPSELHVEVGDEVLFVVAEGYHNMAEERTDRRDARLQSGELDPSTSYSLVFNAPGEISLYDRLNLDIRVTIRVQ